MRNQILVFLGNFFQTKNNIPITHILREINFEDSWSAKSAILTHLEALNFDFYEFLHILKAAIHQINKIQRSKNGKNGNSRTSWFSKIDLT